MEKTIKTGILFRSASFDRAAASKENRTIPLSFSSEARIERFFGFEILSHEPAAIRMDRARGGLPFLWDHVRGQQVGIVENITFGPDKKGRGLARFGKGKLAEEKFQDALDGIAKDASVGYRIHQMILEEEKDGVSTYRATDWEPVEVSLISIPADISVGIARGEGNEFEITIQGAKNKMEEKTRVSEIMAMAQRAGRLDEGLQFVQGDKSVDEFRKLILDTALAGLKPTVQISGGIDRAEGAPFKNFSEYLYSVRFLPTQDPRLRPLAASNFLDEKRAMSMGVGAAGGFAVPELFGAMMAAVPVEQRLIRSKSFVVPAGDPPDASIPFPAVDIGTTHGRVGGFSVSWIGEGVTKPETNLFLREIILTPNECAGTLIATDKLLRNWTAGSAVIESMARNALISTEELAFCSGTGAGQPMGFLSALNTAAINVTRTGPNAIVWADVNSMFRRVVRQGGGSPFWAASSTTLTQLITMKDDGSSLVWQPNARDGIPSSMMGLPFYIYDRLPVLGTRGDLCLLNLNPFYYIKDGSGPYFAASEHVYFETNKTVFKIFWNVDGQPALREAIPLEGNAASTVSPFIILQ